VALIAFLNCPDRSDYNLPLALLAFLIWNHPYQRSQRHRILWLLVFSIICDLIWILGVSVGEWAEVGTKNKLKGLTQLLSVVNCCYKLGLIIYAVVTK
jgi:hypothetical protein